MKLYGRITSFNVQKVLWLLEELGLCYEHIECGGRFGGLDTAAFARLNPMQKVPVLIDGDHVVWESHTILRYLAAEYGGETWYPACAYQRSLSERWMDWGHLTFQQAFMGTFWGYYRMPAEKRDMQAVNESLEQCVNSLNILDKALAEQAFIAGKTITLGDICTGAVLYRLTSQGLDVPLPENVTRWYEQLKQRPGYQRWVMSDFTELKGREDF
ncbi:glutathione S-transferase family protein [Vibrio quintilis]|uniref:Glutathione S-transferase GstB n=1 Tax=Vibrio quintilis TaxID=1117707 RepID=A0A1M7YP26_9VIBR|nr:glutathione S-transferase family protein [Vibrio quintilis]SHO54359.1 Glutathione S-transferase GstB [Vibrio quintilis]